MLHKETNLNEYQIRIWKLHKNVNNFSTSRRMTCFDGPFALCCGRKKCKWAVQNTCHEDIRLTALGILILQLSFRFYVRSNYFSLPFIFVWFILYNKSVQASFCSQIMWNNRIIYRFSDTAIQ